MHKILALWAVPRSISTAFEWMMRRRGDMTCFHEPFGEAWYQGEAPLWPRWREGDKTTPGLTIESVREKIEAAAREKPVFLKDFPHYIAHLRDADFLSGFTHAFLIRDPAKTITSLYDKWPDFDEGEVGFPEQRALFDLLTARNGAPPPVIDGDDLLKAPREMTEAFCEAVGIPFLPEALTWETGADTGRYSWWDGGSFHANLRDSTGLTPQRREYAALENTPVWVQRIHLRMKPHYDRLREHRIRPETPAR